MWLKQESKWENSRREVKEGRAWRGGQESRKWEAVVIACYNIFCFCTGWDGKGLECSEQRNDLV